jgi:two-component system, chemotaxis family, chemotaxis protein CheY
MNKQQTKILIIDDHDAVRLLLGLTLKDKYNVITKRDGIDGMAWLAAGNIPDLIILDMQMPRLNGLDFLKQLRSSGMFKLIPVLLVSANDNEHEITESFDLGIIDFISKPFNPVKLKEKIHQALQKPSFLPMS